MRIGSKTRLHYQEAQRNTFASHKSVRFFFNITEIDDADPTCADNFSPEDAYAVSDFCVSERWQPHQLLMRYMKRSYARPRWLKKKASPHGWMCAQGRPSHGLAKVVAQYRAMKKAHGDKALPDYLVIADDDTYINFELFEQYMSTFDTSAPRAIAGCMVRSPIMRVNFTFPFGGFGMAFSKGKCCFSGSHLGKIWHLCHVYTETFCNATAGAIINYMRPVYCSGDKMDDFSESACRRIADNQIGERHLFQDGMSVSDLQNDYATWQPYVKYKEWTTGFCLHSDWLWGFFSNFYNISEHNDSDFYRDVPHARMDGYNNSELYAGKNEAHHKELRNKICNNERENCDPSLPICHYQTPEDMARLNSEVQKAFPDKYRRI
jgi:hypothetical protein